MLSIPVCVTGKTSKTELAKLILAQDLFGLWGDELTPACTATLIGCQKWAGDEVAPVSLLVYLRDSVPAAQPLMVSDLSSPNRAIHPLSCCATCTCLLDRCTLGIPFYVLSFSDCTEAAHANACCCITVEQNKRLHQSG